MLIVTEHFTEHTASYVTNMYQVNQVIPYMLGGMYVCGGSGSGGRVTKRQYYLYYVPSSEIIRWLKPKPCTYQAHKIIL